MTPYVAQIQVAPTLPQQPAQPALFGIEVGIFLVSTVFGIISYLGKRMIADLEADNQGLREEVKLLRAKCEELAKADLVNSDEIREVRLEMAQNYVSMEVFLHAITVFDSKMDAVADNLKTLMISLKVEKEVRNEYVK